MKDLKFFEAVKAIAIEKGLKIIEETKLTAHLATSTKYGVLNVTVFAERERQQPPEILLIFHDFENAAFRKYIGKETSIVFNGADGVASWSIKSKEKETVIFKLKNRLDMILNR